MKIGIITFHRAENFGAVLQCYALQTFLKSLGLDVEIIDYQSKAICDVYRIVDFSVFKSDCSFWRKVHVFLGHLKTVFPRLEKKIQYIKFRNKYLNLSVYVKNINSLPTDVDCYIVGSDQMWNIALTGGIDDVYFLNTKLNATKITYAVSSETWSYKMLESKSNDIKVLLNNFSNISVREAQFKAELEKYTENPIEVCVDPSFLLNKDAYEKIISSPQNKGYILAYHLVDSQIMTSIAELVSRRNKKELIEIHAGFAKYKDRKRHKCNVGPAELLGYIANADIVFTTSFHGLAFSLIFKKQVWVIDNGGNSRQKNLLCQLGLQNRLIKSSDDILEDLQIDYSNVSIKIDSLVTDSIDFLKKSLKLH